MLVITCICAIICDLTFWEDELQHCMHDDQRERTTYKERKLDPHG